MSTKLYLRCVTHEPYIESENEVGHNLSYLATVRQSIIDRDQIKASMDILSESGSHHDIADQYQRRTWFFLWSHPDCDIEIWDEYNRFYPLEDVDTVPPPVGVETRLGVAHKVEATENGRGLIVHIDQLTDEGRRVLGRMT